MQGYSLQSIIWYVLHQATIVPLSDTLDIGIFYPVLPWIGVMLLGYALGYLYLKEFNSTLRKKWLLQIGMSAIVLFFCFKRSKHLW